jgi:hypothetical protein
MEKPSHAVFARAKLSVVCILIHVLTSWLVITLEWNVWVVLLVLKFVLFPNKGEWAGHIPVYRKQLVWSRTVVYQTTMKCNMMFCAIFIYLVNDANFLYILWHIAYWMLLTFYVNIDNIVNCIQYKVGGATYLVFWQLIHY